MPCNCAKRREQIRQTIQTVKEKISTGVDTIINRGRSTDQAIINRAASAKNKGK